MAHPIIVGDQVWCPLWKEYVQLLKIKKAARVADVSCRTIYRCIEEGRVHSVKIASLTARGSSDCLYQGATTKFLFENEYSTVTFGALTFPRNCDTKSVTDNMLMEEFDPKNRLGQESRTFRLMDLKVAKPWIQP